ncbi:MAG: hypothetical protein AAF720_00275 [Pseudomonadota bacterium]
MANCGSVIYLDPGSALNDLCHGSLKPKQSQNIMALAGPQGSGKSTASATLTQSAGGKAVVLSLDDFYLCKDERRNLAEKVSPLFETRGPPGTHDISLLIHTLEALPTATADNPVWIPQFDKLTDDRLSKDHWLPITEQPETILIEGWCIGAIPEAPFCDASPINDIEKRDTNNAWRTYQLEQLEGPYRVLWQKIDTFYYLTPPSFDSVFHWRLQQEAMLRGIPVDALPQEVKNWVRGFIQYYERLTRAMADGGRMPGTVLQLDDARRVIAVNEET